MFQIGEFKGNPTITLKTREDDRFGITMGLQKAKLILSHVDVLRKFVQDNDKAGSKTEQKEQAMQDRY